MGVRIKRSRLNSFWLRVVAIATAAFFTIGCTSTTPNLAADYLPAGHGVALGSVLAREHDEYRIYYRRIATSDDVVTEARSRGYVELTGRGPDHPMLFDLDLPEGRYELTSWRIESGRRHLKPRHDFSIAFEISAGEVSYLGGFDFSDPNEQLGLVQYADYYNRDTDLASQEFDAALLTKFPENRNRVDPRSWDAVDLVSRRALVKLMTGSF